MGADGLRWVFGGVRGVVYGESDGSVLDKPELDVYILTCCPTCAPDKRPSLWNRVARVWRAEHARILH